MTVAGWQGQHSCELQVNTKIKSLAKQLKLKINMYSSMERTGEFISSTEEKTRKPKKWLVGQGATQAWPPEMEPQTSLREEGLLKVVLWPPQSHTPPFSHSTHAQNHSTFLLWCTAVWLRALWKEEQFSWIKRFGIVKMSIIFSKWNCWIHAILKVFWGESRHINSKIHMKMQRMWPGETTGENNKVQELHPLIWRPKATITIMQGKDQNRRIC